MPLSKSEYILWRDCSHTAWLKKWRRATYDACAGVGLSDFERALVVTGNQVEEQARRLFPSGKLIEGRGKAEIWRPLEDSKFLVFGVPGSPQDAATIAAARNIAAGDGRSQE